MPILIRIENNFQELFSILYQLRARGKVVIIADNITLSEGVYGRYLEKLGLSKMCYQSLCTSLGFLNDYVALTKDNLQDTFGQKVFVIGDYKDLLGRFERVSSFHEADWIMCGDIQPHDYSFLQHIKNTRGNFRHFLWPQQDVNFIERRQKEIPEFLVDLQKSNPQARFIISGFPQQSFWDYISSQVHNFSPKEVVFVSHYGFCFWEDMKKYDIPTLAIGNEDLMVHGLTHYFVTNLKW